MVLPCFLMCTKFVPAKSSILMNIVQVSEKTENPLVFKIFRNSLFEELKDYMIGIVSIAAFGVVPAVLLLLFALPWCCARTFCRRCCKCCQGHARKRDKWTCFNIWSARITAITCILIFM